MPRDRRRICFVSGTRAEFGLMRTTLEAIRAHPELELQIVLTGMHLDRRRGRSIDVVTSEGWNVNAVVPWRGGTDPVASATATGRAIGEIARTLDRLRTDVVLVVGDRVEAFAAATAAHVSRRVVAHVHGGDRAMGQVDDALRHAITKLAHIHFPATRQSAERIAKLGEDTWRIHRVGAPGIDGVAREAASWRDLTGAHPTLSRRRYALIVLHPIDPDDRRERDRADLVLNATRSAGIEQVVLIAPNNDPGADGILATWERVARDPHVTFIRNAPRPLFLGFLRDAAVHIGNSSSGIIEAASFGTMVVNVGERQAGRERGKNVIDVPYSARSIRSAVATIWNDGRPRRFTGRNLYGGTGTGRRIAQVLARTSLTNRLRVKLITY